MLSVHSRQHPVSVLKAAFLALSQLWYMKLLSRHLQRITNTMKDWFWVRVCENFAFRNSWNSQRRWLLKQNKKKNYRSVAPSCFRKWKFGNKDNTVTHGNFRLPFTWQHFKEKKKRNCFGRYFCSQHPLFDDITQVLKDDGLRLAGTSVESVTSLGWVTPRADDEEYRVFQFPETMQPSISLLAFSAKLCLHIHTWKNTTDPS